MPPLASLNLTVPAAAVAAGLDDRSVTGVALPYREVGRTSAGAVSVDPGALRIPAELRHVKLFTDHGRATPVGYATAAADSADRLAMTFRVAATPAGDTALLEAAEGVRDALSVELSDVTIKGGVIVSAALDAVALVPLPAYQTARLMLAADTDPAAAVDVAVAITPTPPAEDDDDDAEGDPDDPNQEDTMPDPAAPPTPPLTAAAGGAITLAAAADRITNAARGALDAAQINAALSDIVPANDPAEGYLRRQWIDELWTPVYQQLYLTNAVGSAPLTGTKVVGWRWVTRPQVGDYLGNKTAIPSNTVSLEAAEADAYRLAGGWDIDRIFEDLAQGSMTASVLNMAAEDLALKIEAKVAAAVQAAATPVGTGIDDPFAGITAAVQGVVAGGGRPTFVAVASDLYAAMLGVAAAGAPWWLSGGSLDIVGGSLTLGSGGPTVGLVPSLADGTVLAGDKRAFTHYQSPSIRVQALNIPNGGIDVALFSYGADLVNHDAALVSVDVTLPVPAP